MNLAALAKDLVGIQKVIMDRDVLAFVHRTRVAKPNDLKLSHDPKMARLLRKQET